MRLKGRRGRRGDGDRLCAARLGGFWRVVAFGGVTNDSTYITRHQ